MKKMRRGRSRLPRSYYLVKTAKHGGFEVGNRESMPVISNPGIGLGQEEYRTVERVEAGMKGAKVIIGLAVTALLGYLGYKVIKGEI